MKDPTQNMIQRLGEKVQQVAVDATVFARYVEKGNKMDVKEWEQVVASLNDAAKRMSKITGSGEESGRL